VAIPTIRLACLNCEIFYRLLLARLDSHCRLSLSTFFKGECRREGGSRCRTRGRYVFPGDRVPWRGVAGGGSPRLPAWSGQVSWRTPKADGGIIADWRDGFQRHVAGALHRPFVILFEQDGADETDDSVLVGKMPTTSVRRLISPLRRSIGLVECSLVRWAGGKPI
jgi:hypothetical protein